MTEVQDEAKLAKTIANLIAIIEVETDRKKLFNWYRNAHEKNIPTIMRAATIRAIQLKAKGFDPEDDFENAVFHALAGYEIALSIKHDKRVAANRTRGLLKRMTAQEAINYLVDPKRETTGIKLLTSMQLAEFTFESVVDSYPDHFEEVQVKEAKRRLDEILNNRPIDFVFPELKRNLF